MHPSFPAPARPGQDRKLAGARRDQAGFPTLDRNQGETMFPVLRIRFKGDQKFAPYECPDLVHDITDALCRENLPPLVPSHRT